MPILTKGDKVLVTGANGFIALWAIQILLEHGYAVRGTVRSHKKSQYLGMLFNSFGDQFEIVVVPDMTSDGAFDESVKGVDAVVHTATPVHGDANDPKDIIEPAVKGTTGILHSILKHGSNFKRALILSSVAAIVEIGKSKVYTESDWSDASVTAVNALGSETPGIMKYMASKVLAEKAAWNLYEENKGKLSWDLTVINPPWVYGPVLNEVNSPEALNSSMLTWYRSLMIPDTAASDEAWSLIKSFIDVRDLAGTLALALEKEEAGGERIIVTARDFVWQDFIDAAHALSPSPIPAHRISKGQPDALVTSTNKKRFDTGKAERILGIKHYRSIEETTRDILADFQQRGW